MIRDHEENGALCTDLRPKCLQAHEARRTRMVSRSPVTAADSSRNTIPGL